MNTRTHSQTTAMAASRAQAGVRSGRFVQLSAALLALSLLGLGLVQMVARA